MTGFVLDNSVTMRWLLSSTRPSDQKYAETVLESLVNSEAITPNLWHLEVANALLGASRRSDIEIADVERFTVQLEKLPIDVDNMTASQVFAHTLSLARAYKLSSYDAAYLELALRKAVPLATLDTTLAKAARKSGVELYLK